MNEELKKEIILENYSNPSNYGKVEDESYDKYNTNNESCVDNLNFYIKIDEGIIKDLKFEGEACAISKSSSSICTDNIIGKTIKEAIEYISEFENMIDPILKSIHGSNRHIGRLGNVIEGNNISNDEKLSKNTNNEEVLHDACCFCDIYKQNNRRNCAYLPYRGLKKYLENYHK